jgi:hypothetical protein
VASASRCAGALRRLRASLFRPVGVDPTRLGRDRSYDPGPGMPAQAAHGESCLDIWRIAVNVEGVPVPGSEDIDTAWFPVNDCTKVDRSCLGMSRERDVHTNIVGWHRPAVLDIQHPVALVVTEMIFQANLLVGPLNTKAEHAGLLFWVKDVSMWSILMSTCRRAVTSNR